jgi:hypothetical protein
MEGGPLSRTIDSLILDRKLLIVVAIISPDKKRNIEAREKFKTVFEIMLLRRYINR